MDKIICFLFAGFVAIQAQFIVERGERDVFRNLTSCTKDTQDFCYFLHAEKSKSDPCICRCMVKYPLYRNPDVYPGQPGEFISKGKPGCVWHSNHRYECFHIRKLGRGKHTSDDEGALEFDLSKPGSFLAYADHDLSKCKTVETSVKMPDESDFTPKPGLLNATYGRFDVIRFNWEASVERHDGGLLRGVFRDCGEKIDEAGRCFVGKIIGMYNGGKCKVRALNGQCCILPFTYKGRVYNNCTRAESEEAWCAVRLPFFGNETNWRQNCTNSSKILPSSSPIVQSSSSPTETIVLPTKIMSTHSLLELKPTESVRRPILGLTVLPGPPQSRLVAKKRTSSSEGPGTNLISKSYVSPSATDSMKPNKTSSTTHNRSAIIDYTPSVSRYTPTMVNYTSPVSGSIPYNQSSMVGNTSSMNYTPSMIDYQITPSTDFMMKSVNFTSSVSSPVLPEVSASESDTDGIAIVVIIVMAAVTFVVVAFISCLFLCRRHWKSRTKKYKVIDKKPGNPATQSPVTENVNAAENQIQNEAVVIDESESEIAETEFTIPEKDEQEMSQKPSGKYYGPSFITFRL